MSLRNILSTAVLGMALLAGACGGNADASRSEAGATTAAPTREAGAPEAAVTPTGTVIEVAMITDGEGNYFEPADFEVRQGDLVRFVLISGVHNVSFPAAENAGKSGLPAPSDYLQLPGQAFELLVTLEPGKYFYQCDPHAALGMVGNMEVVAD
jgi:plastocyanin